MAVATVETIVANPARKRTHMAKRMTLKQRLHFGTKRQRAAARLRLRRKRNAGKGGFSKESKLGTGSFRAKLRKLERHGKSAQAKYLREKRRREMGPSTWGIDNPGEIIAMTLGNPARKKGRKTMAATRTRRHRRNEPDPRRSRRRRIAQPRARRKHNPSRRRRSGLFNPRRRHHYSHRHNPAGYRWTDVFILGGGALVGSTLSSAGTQLILSTSNTGVMGYAGNLIATFLLSWLGGMVTRNKAFPAGILAGGIGALMKRIIGDYSLLGGYTSQLGMGDYLVSNWVTPQRLVSDFRSLTTATMGQGQWGQQTAPPALAMSSSGVSTRGMGLEGDSGTGTAGY